VTAVTVTIPKWLGRLNSARKRLGITHDMIAARAKCDRTYVVHFFSGRRAPARLRVVTEELVAEARRERPRRPREAALAG
jgi:hypothetical protein